MRQAADESDGNESNAPIMETETCEENIILNERQSGRGDQIGSKGGWKARFLKLTGSSRF
jgi:hypothetical protein